MAQPDVSPWAHLAAGNITAAIWAAIKRTLLIGGTDEESYRVASQVARAAARAEGNLSASAVLNVARHGVAAMHADEIKGVYYTSILDKNRCAACAAADDGVLRQMGDPELTPVPNPLCEGWTKCRCMYAYVLHDEQAPHLLGDAQVADFFLDATFERLHARDPRTGRWIDETPGFDAHITEGINPTFVDRALASARVRGRGGLSDPAAVERRRGSYGPSRGGSPALQDAAIENAMRVSANEAHAISVWQTYPRFSTQQPDWRQMAHAVRRGEVPERTELLRGVRPDHFPGGRIPRAGARLDLPFIATTPCETGGYGYADEGGVLMHIDAPAGMPAAYPDAIDEQWGDAEVVLGPRRWKVTRVETDGETGLVHVYVTPQEDLDTNHNGVMDTEEDMSQPVMAAKPPRVSLEAAGPPAPVTADDTHLLRLRARLGDADALPLAEQLRAHPRRMSSGRRPSRDSAVRFSIAGRNAVGLEGDMLDELDRLEAGMGDPAQAVEFARMLEALQWVRSGQITEGRGATAGSYGVRVEMGQGSAIALHGLLRRTGRGAAARDIERSFREYQPDSEFGQQLIAARRDPNPAPAPTAPGVTERVIGTPSMEGGDPLPAGDLDITEDTIRQLWNGFTLHHPDGDLTIRASAHRYGDEMRVSISVLDEHGTNRGEASRTFSGLSPGRVPTVYNSLFSLHPSVQGRGLAQHFAARSEEAYRRMGISEVSVGAGLSGGGYTWATQGFLFDLDPVRCKQVAQRKAMDLYASKVSEIRTFFGDSAADAIQQQLQDCETESDIARLGREFQVPATQRMVDRHYAAKLGYPVWAGKVMMNGSSWNGRKSLGPGRRIPPPSPDFLANEALSTAAGVSADPTIATTQDHNRLQAAIEQLERQQAYIAGQYEIGTSGAETMAQVTAAVDRIEARIVELRTIQQAIEARHQADFPSAMIARRDAHRESIAGLRRRFEIATTSRDRRQAVNAMRAHAAEIADRLPAHTLTPEQRAAEKRANEEAAAVLTAKANMLAPMAEALDPQPDPAALLAANEELDTLLNRSMGRLGGPARSGIMRSFSRAPSTPSERWQIWDKLNSRRSSLARKLRAGEITQDDYHARLAAMYSQAAWQLRAGGFHTGSQGSDAAIIVARQWDARLAEDTGVVPATPSTPSPLPDGTTLPPAVVQRRRVAQSWERAYDTTRARIQAEIGHEVAFPDGAEGNVYVEGAWRKIRVLQDAWQVELNSGAITQANYDARVAAAYARLYQRLRLSSRRDGDFGYRNAYRYMEASMRRQGLL